MGGERRSRKQGTRGGEMAVPRERTDSREREEGWEAYHLLCALPSAELPLQSRGCAALLDNLQFSVFYSLHYFLKPSHKV